MFRVTGANLIAFNDVTKKAMATINLKKAIAVEDTQDARSAALSPDGRYRDNYDSLIAVERSFRLVFPSEQEILFFADSDEEKAKWYIVRYNSWALTDVCIVQAESPSSSGRSHTTEPTLGRARLAAPTRDGRAVPTQWFSIIACRH